MTNQNGRFGVHGGQYIPETLMRAADKTEMLSKLRGTV